MTHLSDPNATLTFQVQLWQRSGQVHFAYYTLFNSAGQPVDWTGAAVGFNYGIGRKYAGPSHCAVILRWKWWIRPRRRWTSGI